MDLMLSFKHRKHNSIRGRLLMLFTDPDRYLSSSLSYRSLGVAKGLWTGTCTTFEGAWNVSNSEVSLDWSRWSSWNSQLWNFFRYFSVVWVGFILCGPSSWSKLKYIPILEPFTVCKDNLDPAHGDSCRFWTWKLQKCAFLIANILPRWQVLEYILQQEKGLASSEAVPKIHTWKVWFGTVWFGTRYVFHSLDHLSWDTGYCTLITRPANQGTQKDSWRVCWEPWITCLNVLSDREILALAPDINKIRETSNYQNPEHDCTSCTLSTNSSVPLQTTMKPTMQHHQPSPWRIKLLFYMLSPSISWRIQQTKIRSQGLKEVTVAQPDRIGQLVFALAILQEIFIWGFATMSCWAMNSVKSELDLREFYSCTSSCAALYISLSLWVSSGTFQVWTESVMLQRSKLHIASLQTAEYRIPFLFHPFSMSKTLCFCMFLLSFCFWFTSLGPFLSRSLCFGLEIRYIAVLGLVFGLHISGLHLGSLCVCTRTKPTRMACVLGSTQMRESWRNAFVDLSFLQRAQGPEEATKRFQQIQEAYSARLWDSALGEFSNWDNIPIPRPLLVEFCIADYCKKAYIIDYVCIQTVMITTTLTLGWP